ncbi:MAG: glycosyltransferase family 2 protein [Proteobacteria bacterium]|nr:glycosyltransferase family 2 protein [Pseudomonadota bacterium]MBS0574162.1 glycosyltransferase family 2 protein [Pseudomonadota bacterium]
MSSSPPRATIITVAYNSTAVLPAMLASVPAGVPVVLVDNGSADLADLRALAARTGARLVENGQNLGFGPACNVGAALADTEFLLFLNPDTVLTPEATARLEAAMDRHPAASAANPRLTDGSGRPYFKRRSVLLPRSEWLAKGWPATECEVPVLSGAALFVRRAAFTLVGGFDPRIFLYHEDDDLSLRLRAGCGPLLFVRDAEVRHLEGRSTVRSAASAALKARHMGWSRVYAMRKHRLPFAAARALASAAGQLLLPLNWLSARRRAKQWAFLKGVVSGLAK